MHALLFGGMTLAVQWRTQPAAPMVEAAITLIAEMIESRVNRVYRIYEKPL